MSFVWRFDCTCKLPDMYVIKIPSFPFHPSPSPQPSPSTFLSLSLLSSPLAFPSYLEDLDVTVANILFMQLFTGLRSTVHRFQLHIAVTSRTILFRKKIKTLLHFTYSCRNGPPFTNYSDSHFIVHSAADIASFPGPPPSFPLLAVEPGNEATAHLNTYFGA